MLTRFISWLAIGLAAAFLVVVSDSFTSRSQAEVPAHSAGAKPTVVLVNGAWANNASWTGVIQRLQARGYPVIAPPDPLQSLKGDAATIADLLKTIHGPVILVGHSYGGAVITNVHTGATT
jgi:pimeloyl-ACP methyl ester carboxylesterase